MNIDELVTPISDESPAGEDLEYDPEYLELERAAQGTPARSIGDHETEAIPPDWRAVREQAINLLGRTRDFRIAVILANALVRLDGYPGLRDGLRLVERLTQDFWDNAHPMLDADDGDPTMRCNAVRELVNREALLQGVLDAPFVESRIAGRFGLRDLKIAEGELKRRVDDERPPADRNLIGAAFREAPTESVAATAEVVSECIALVDSITAEFTTRVGSVDTPDLSELEKHLQAVSKFVAEQMRHLGLVGASGGEPVEAGAEDGAVAAGGPSISGAIRSREDVLRVLDKICVYYAQQEPSSPVPLLLRRAASLVNKTFLDIVADLTPSGMSEAKLFWSDDAARAADDGAGVARTEESW